MRLQDEDIFRAYFKRVATGGFKRMESPKPKIKLPKDIPVGTSKNKRYERNN